MQGLGVAVEHSHGVLWSRVPACAGTTKDTYFLRRPAAVASTTLSTSSRQRTISMASTG